jgi:hypothetical protein
LEASELDAALPAIPETATLHRASELDRMRWINRMSADIGANSEERINLQKALLELEDASVCNRAELEQLEEYVQVSCGGKTPSIPQRCVYMHS